MEIFTQLDTILFIEFTMAKACYFHWFTIIVMIITELGWSWWSLSRVTCGHYTRGVSKVDEMEECGKQLQGEDTMPVDFFCQVADNHWEGCVVIMMMKYLKSCCVFLLPDDLAEWIQHRPQHWLEGPSPKLHSRLQVTLSVFLLYSLSTFHYNFSKIQRPPERVRPTQTVRQQDSVRWSPTGKSKQIFLYWSKILYIWRKDIFP